MSRSRKIESGIPGLDLALQNIRLGDAVVWQITEIDAYRKVVAPLAEKAIQSGKKLTYFRFAEHEALLPEQEGLNTIHVDPDLGFETFTVTVNRIIDEQGPGVYYIFDCLSELQSVWAADFMIRNFFMAVCPSLKDIHSLGYLSIMPHKHSYNAMRQIREVATLFINLVSGGADLYIHPLKVNDRHSPTMFLPHRFDDIAKTLKPLTDGITSSKYYALLGSKGISSSHRNLDNWDIFFMNANIAQEQDEATQEQIKEKLYRVLIGRDMERAKLFKREFSIRDYLDIYDRLIGSGSIGGKSAGMLIARKILENNRPDLAEYLEPHDSFYIGTNVFYTYLISNNFGKLWMEHKSDEGYYMAARVLKSQISYGNFPELVRDKFKIMLDHFGQNPIIVRSSSFLEDGFGNAFAGKYDSVFCVNVGTPEERYENLVRAVKEVYASALDESALVYRQRRGLDKSDEHMSILVQRVSGSIFQDIYMPGAAGVGYSSNSYAWHKDIDPHAGLVRIVAGLGTRAVDRISNDYPRIASLDKPSLALGGKADFVQRNVDVLDLHDNSLQTIHLDEVAQKAPGWYLRLIAEHDREAEELLRESGVYKDVIYTTCNNILSNKKLTTTLKEMLSTIQEHYNYPVDVEFTINFDEDGEFLINLVQCRPLQAKGTGAHSITIPDVPDDQIFFRLSGGAMGGPINLPIDLVAIVDAHGYFNLNYNAKYGVARAVEAINHYAKANGKRLMLLGPGRWGTSSPELGINTCFSQICNVAALCETSFETEGFMPELSFGSHFFQDLVESNIFYGAVFMEECVQGKKSTYNPALLKNLPDLYPEIPDTLQSYKSVIKLYDTSQINLQLLSNSTSDQTICYALKPDGSQIPEKGAGLSLDNRYIKSIPVQSA